MRESRAGARGEGLSRISGSVSSMGGSSSSSSTCVDVESHVQRERIMAAGRRGSCMWGLSSEVMHAKSRRGSHGAGAGERCCRAGTSSRERGTWGTDGRLGYCLGRGGWAQCAFSHRVRHNSTMVLRKAPKEPSFRSVHRVRPPVSRTLWSPESPPEKPGSEETQRIPHRLIKVWARGRIFSGILPSQAVLAVVFSWILPVDLPIPT